MKLTVDHVCNSGTILQKLGKKEKEKRMIVSEQYQNPLYLCRQRTQQWGLEAVE
jgi:hypothetical protein